MLGLGTRVIYAAFAVIMIGAILTVKWAKGFTGGYELDLVLLAIPVHLLLSGSELYALDNAFRRRVQN